MPSSLLLQQQVRHERIVDVEVEVFDCVDASAVLPQPLSLLAKLHRHLRGVSAHMCASLLLQSCPGWPCNNEQARCSYRAGVLRFDGWSSDLALVSMACCPARVVCHKLGFCSTLKSSGMLVKPRLQKLSRSEHLCCHCRLVAWCCRTVHMLRMLFWGCPVVWQTPGQWQSCVSALLLFFLFMLQHVTSPGLPVFQSGNVSWLCLSLCCLLFILELRSYRACA
jgi:hypothetical protein